MIIPENLHGKKFTKLTNSDLWDLIFAYADFNKYPIESYDEIQSMGYINPKKYFEDNFFYIWELERFFNTWTT